MRGDGRWGMNEGEGWGVVGGVMGGRVRDERSWAGGVGRGV